MAALGLIMSLTFTAARAYAQTPPHRPSGAPVLLVHGINEREPEQGWAEVKAALAPRTVAIFRYDWHKGWDDPAVMQALDEQVGQLARQSPTGQVDLIAHSNGGLISRYYVTAWHGKNGHRVRNLIMIGTPNKGSFGAYAVRLSTMLNDPERYHLPEDWRKLGQDLFNEYADEEIWSLQRLWSQPRPFFRWVREERPDTWRNIRFSTDYETGGSDLYSEGFQQLAALYRGINDEYEYTLNTVIPKDPEEIDDLNRSTLWLMDWDVLGLDPWSRHNDRLLPEEVELDMGRTPEGERLYLNLVINLRLRDLNRMWPPYGVKLAGISTTRQGEIGRNRKYWLGERLGLTVDPHLHVGPHDGIVEVSSLQWGPGPRLLDARFHMDGPNHSNQREQAAIHQLLIQLLDRDFEAGTPVELDQPITGSIHAARVEPPSPVEHWYGPWWTSFRVADLPPGMALPVFSARVRGIPYQALRLIEDRHSLDVHMNLDGVYEYSRPEAEFRSLSIASNLPFSVEYAWGESLADAPLHTGGVLQVDLASVFALDVSGSMGQDWGGATKLDREKVAAGVALDQLHDAEGYLGIRSAAAIVLFDGETETAAPLGSDVASARQSVARARIRGSTNIGQALLDAIEELRLVDASVRQIVLLTDGHPTTGMNRQEILDAIPATARASDIAIHTVGVGEEADIDLLQTLAEETGGTFLLADSPFEMENFYIRNTTQGEQLYIHRGTITQGQWVDLGEVTLGSENGALRITANWPGSNIDIQVTGPDGRQLVPGEPGITWLSAGRPKRLQITAPAQGKYSIRIFGADLPTPEPYEVTVALIPIMRTALEEATALGLGLLLLAGTALAIAGSLQGDGQTTLSPPERRLRHKPSLTRT